MNNSVEFDPQTNPTQCASFACQSMAASRSWTGPVWLCAIKRSASPDGLICKDQLTSASSPMANSSATRAYEPGPAELLLVPQYGVIHSLSAPAPSLATLVCPLESTPGITKGLIAPPLLERSSSY